MSCDNPVCTCCERSYLEGLQDGYRVGYRRGFVRGYVSGYASGYVDADNELPPAITTNYLIRPMKEISKFLIAPKWYGGYARSEDSESEDSE